MIADRQRAGLMLNRHVSQIHGGGDVTVRGVAVEGRRIDVDGPALERR